MTGVSICLALMMMTSVPCVNSILFPRSLLFTGPQMQQGFLFRASYQQGVPDNILWC